MDEIAYFFRSGSARTILQTVDNIFFGIEIGKERIVLKNNIEAALFHRNVRHILAVNQNASGGCRHQPEN